MRIKVTVTGYYDVATEQMEEAYGTKNPTDAEILEVESNYNEFELLEVCDVVDMRLEVIR